MADLPCECHLPNAVKRLIAIAVVQTVLYSAIAWLSRGFAYGTEETSRPILLVLVLFAVSFALYLAAIRTAVADPATRRLGWAIIVPALLFRGLLLPTPPIQEVDIYRYLWDGAVSAQGQNPYRFAPAQVSAASTESDRDTGLGSLVDLRSSSTAMTEVLARIHYADLTTVYPPVSQAVFAVGDWLAPRDASINTRVTILKCLLLLFDVATIGVVGLLLSAVGKHPGWMIAYAWCPLVIKEFANSGHLDSIAVFLTTAAVYSIVRFVAAKEPTDHTTWLIAGAVLLSLAVGAKLYAIVLLPVLCAAIASTSDVVRAFAFAGLTVLLSTVLVSPMLVTTPSETGTTEVHLPVPQDIDDGPADGPAETVALPGPPIAHTAVPGLATFVTRWEMNDFLFMLVVENVRPENFNSQDASTWFVVMPNSWREAFVTRLANLIGTDVQTTAFLFARLVTTSLFVIILVRLVWQVNRIPNARRLLEASFLTLAWFWLLSPTQNPWYWTWALPLLPFATGRAWYAASGLAFAYYVRFWLQYQFPAAPVCGMPYNGAQFFDYVITWIEYSPWLVWLAVAMLWRGLHGPRGDG